MRVAWQQRTEVAAAAPVDPAVQAEAAPIAICTAIKGDGQRCSKIVHTDGLCRLHHTVALRRLDDMTMRPVMRQLHVRFRRGDTPALMTAYVNAAVVDLSARCRMEVVRRLQMLIRHVYINEIRDMLNDGGTIEQVDAHVQVLVIDGAITPLDADQFMQYAAAEQRRIEWHRANPVAPNHRVWGPQHREAALAHDGQNVHTSEITKQMTDSVAILLAVQVPDTQTTTMKDISASWIAQGHDIADINVVIADVIRWWNMKTIYKENDKLYKRMMRALWCTITGYTGELRKELEKRLWDECRDACIPYSVCTQGHIARLSNVMVGFDDAFIPPVPVGEILQQKMAAISAMDIEYDKQIEMAEAVLAELKIPHEEHKNWLAAF